VGFEGSKAATAALRPAVISPEGMLRLTGTILRVNAIEL
jgi:hypothetical protein